MDYKQVRKIAVSSILVIAVLLVMWRQIFPAGRYEVVKIKLSETQIQWYLLLDTVSGQVYPCGKLELAVQKPCGVYFDTWYPQLLQ